MAKAPQPNYPPDSPPGRPAPDPLVHPDPQGKMRSYAPGHGPGPDGEAVELPEAQKDQNTTGTVGFNPVHLPQRSQ